MEKTGAVDSGILQSGLGLSPREYQVLDFISRGLSDCEIAASCGISTRTASKHVENILRKLNVHSRTRAAVLFVSALKESAPLA